MENHTVALKYFHLGVTDDIYTSSPLVRISHMFINQRRLGNVVF